MLFSSFLQLVILFTFNFFKPFISLNISHVPFTEAFSPLYGYQNVVPSEDGKSVQISMNKWSPSGAGFVSRYLYNHGFFIASIKLPDNSYSAGIVATFYLQNNEPNHDEIDFEFLGHIPGEEWVLQTNLYGNGSVDRGREERFILPFDPSEDFHNYGIFWNTGRVVYFVDGIIIREVQNVEGMAGDFPSKPMFLYGTIWDGSNWATHKGKYRADFDQGPFVTGYSWFIINGCQIDPTQSISQSTNCDIELPSVISLIDRIKLKAYRDKYMTYSYCYDLGRYPISLPECEVQSPGPAMQPAEAPIPGEGRIFL